MNRAVGFATVMLVAVGVALVAFGQLAAIALILYARAAFHGVSARGRG